MPRLRTILAVCVLVLLLSVSGTALLSSVQRLHGEVTLERGVRRERVARTVRSRPRPTRRQRATRETRSGPGAEASAAAPRVAFAPAPRYPIEALRKHRQGLVEVRVQLGPDGRVLDAAVQHTSGDPELDRAAVRAVRRWTFDLPPHARRVTVLPIRFHIDAPHP